jgi:hypothetical protein
VEGWCQLDSRKIGKATVPFLSDNACRLKEICSDDAFVCSTSCSHDYKHCYDQNLLLQQQWPVRGARYLTGENLKVVWAEFSTLS